jgi:4-alpha-glucanotransferase
MKRCKKCGCTEFTAHQRLYTDIIVDGDNNFLQNNSMDGSISVYEHENPYGPYECRFCGEVYEDLHDLPEANEKN